MGNGHVGGGHPPPQGAQRAHAARPSTEDIDGETRLVDSGAQGSRFDGVATLAEGSGEVEGKDLRAASIGIGDHLQDV